MTYASAKPYCSIADVQQHLPDGTWGTSYEKLLDALCVRASRDIDLYTERKAGAYCADTDVTLYFAGKGRSELWIDELAALPTTLAVAESGLVDNAANTGGTYTTWAARDFFLWPDNALEDGKPFLRIDVDLVQGSKSFFYPARRSVKITGKFGYSQTVPPEVKEATIAHAVNLFKRGQQAFQTAGANIELGRLVYIKPEPQVQNLIAHLLRWRP